MWLGDLDSCKSVNLKRSIIECVVIKLNQNLHNIYKHMKAKIADQCKNKEKIPRNLRILDFYK